MDSEGLKNIVRMIVAHGLQIEPKALEKLSKLDQSVLDTVINEILDKVMERGGFIITLNDVEEYCGIKREQVEASVSVKQMSAREVESKLEVLFDPTDKIHGGNSIDDFYRYFKSRFKKLEKILRRRIDVGGSTTISNALKASLKSHVKFIGMVTEKIKRRGFKIQLEDLESSITVIISENSDRKLIEKALMVLQDQVICVSGVKVAKDVVLADDIIFPDVPDHKPRRSDEEVYAVLTSDIHIGSKLFMEKCFEKFLRWLNGLEGSKPFRELAGKVKYLLVCGDLVDGVGVYPGQDRELAVDSLTQQYKLIAEYFAKIPEHIETVVIPGNHDASRQALPQPAIFRKYSEPLYDLDNVRILGNPCWISIHGVDVLMHHGRSLDDVIAYVPGLTFQEPDKAMEILLKARHLTPIYGLRTAIAPEAEDYLVIEREPTIFHSGHIHVARHRFYRNSLIVNSGAWQNQTEYQKRNGLKPLPGIVPIVNLKTLQVIYIDFREANLEARAEAL
ncbi:DNA-directed DNA polymerase II small subunit [Candidatus Bathyarchaeota archaeon]|nr:DNA-directed DNA polymerase II small subunit [Candidatus Bathyarchaeota archaeon]MBS7617193.1 DNA-directed DNA polymerase II small subunit [Candidatus Bathyarchaeota archaeon]